MSLSKIDKNFLKLIDVKKELQKSATRWVCYRDCTSDKLGLPKFKKLKNNQSKLKMKCIFQFLASSPNKNIVFIV